MTATDIAIVGVGKIARDQHVPSIGRSEAFNLAATVSSHGGVKGVENHATLEGTIFPPTICVFGQSASPQS